MLILPAETTGIYYGYKSAIKTALKPQTIDPILTLLIHMTTELQTLLQASFFVLVTACRFPMGEPAAKM